MSWKGVITNKGRELMEQWAGGNEVLTIDSASVGSGQVAEAEMKSATDLSSKQSDAQIVSQKTTEQGIQLKILVGPAATVSYTAREIGLWAHLGNDEPVLFALHQDVGGTGVSIPTAEVSPNFAFALFLIHAITDEGSLKIITDSNAYVTESSLDAAMDSVDEKLRFPTSLSPEGPIILKQNVHYFSSFDDLPPAGTVGRIAFVKAQ